MQCQHIYYEILSHLGLKKCHAITTTGNPFLRSLLYLQNALQGHNMQKLIQYVAHSFDFGSICETLDAEFNLQPPHNSLWASFTYFQSIYCLHECIKGVEGSETLFLQSLQTSLFILLFIKGYSQSSKWKDEVSMLLLLFLFALVYFTFRLSTCVHTKNDCT